MSAREPNMRNIDELVYMLGSLLPSQRAVLLDQAKNDPGQFKAGLDSFLSKWARADWLEEYNVERVGEWIAKHCPEAVKRDAESLAKAIVGDAVPSPTNSIKIRTYRAILNGMARVKQPA